jgi:Uma2 family endonuclease
MTILLTDPSLEERLILERQRTGADRYDEVWEGIYVMSPIANVEHQDIVTRLAAVLQEVVGWPRLGSVFAGLNLSDRGDDWEHNYRVPDVAVFLRGTEGENLDTHWRGAADFLVEVTSPGDRTREKLPFYGSLGVKELLIVDRQFWSLELYFLCAGELQSQGRSDPQSGDVLQSSVLPLTFRLVRGDPRPQIEVSHAGTARSWLV